MKKTLIVLLLSAVPLTSSASELTAKTGPGNFAISVYLSCKLVKEKGFTADSLRQSLEKAQGMNAESAANLASYATNWIDNNPGKECQQIFVDVIDKIYAANPSG